MGQPLKLKVMDFEKKRRYHDLAYICKHKRKYPPSLHC